MINDDLDVFDILNSVTDFRPRGITGRFYKDGIKHGLLVAIEICRRAKCHTSKDFLNESFAKWWTDEVTGAVVRRELERDDELNPRHSSKT